MQSYEIIRKKTHNLEVPGSSPGWSTIKIPNRLLFSSLLGVFFICVNRMSIKPLLTIRFYLTYATVNNGSVDISSITVSSFSIWYHATPIFFCLEVRHFIKYKSSLCRVLICNDKVVLLPSDRVWCNPT